MRLGLISSFNPLDAYRHYGLFNRIKKDLHALIAETGNSYPLDVRSVHAREGSLKFTDAYILKQILHKYKPGTILEVGMLNDRGSISFHDALSWTGVNKAMKEIKVNYRDRAEVGIYGDFDRAILKPVNIHIDGIGFFRLLS